MGWLRTDDGFDTHPKMLALGDGIKGGNRRWMWNRILLYTNRHGSGVIPSNIGEAITGATKSFVRDCVNAGLADIENDGTIVVHDWLLYADVAIRDKVRYYLGRFPTATANEVIKGIHGGTREIVLNEVRLYHNNHPGTTEPPPNQYDRTTNTGSESGSRTPDPRSFKSKALPTTDLDIHAPEPAADTPNLEHLKTLLDQIGVHDGLRLAAMQDPARAEAWAVKALQSATSSPAGFFRSTFETGRWPAPPEAPRPAPLPPCVSCGVGGGLHVAECPDAASVPPDDESEAA